MPWLFYDLPEKAHFIVPLVAFGKLKVFDRLLIHSKKILNGANKARKAYKEGM